MKVLKLNKSDSGYEAAVATLRASGNRVFNRADCGWASAPDDHGLKAPLLVKEYATAEDAIKDGCPPPMIRFAV